MINITKKQGVRRGRKGKGRAGKDGDRAAGEGDGRGKKKGRGGEKGGEKGRHHPYEILDPSLPSSYHILLTLLFSSTDIARST